MTTANMQTYKNKQIIGWREWVGLPDLGIKKIKAKIDTGARTSTLDAEHYEVFEQDGVPFVRFRVKYGTRKNPREKTCVAALVESRKVTNSGGWVEERIVISTTIQIGSLRKKIEITLTRRPDMKFRMLLGRTTVNQDFLIDAGGSCLTREKQK